jgi:capsular exopolysaccharide synthesis family protein
MTTPAQETGRQRDDIHLKDYLWVAYKRRWAILAFFSVVVVLTALYSFTAVPLYEAKTRILIERDNPNIVDFKELYAIDTTAQDFYQTQYEIIKSRFIASKVIDRLGLLAEGNPGTGGDGLVSRLLTWLSRGADDPRERMVRVVQENMRVEPIRNTRLADVFFVSPNPELAARAAGAIVDAYVESSLGMKIEAIQGATEFLTQKIEEQRGRLEESELLLQKYKEQYNIISLEEKANITVQKLEELNSEVLRAESERVEAETRYRQAQALEDKTDMIESIPQVLDNKLVQQMKSEDAVLQTELSDLLKKYGEKHPRIVSIREKQRAMRETLLGEIRKVVKYLRNEYEVALAKERTVKKAFEEQKDESQLLNKYAIAYGVLARDVETNKQMYDILLTRLKEAGITGGMQSTNVRVVDAAITPRSPVRPNKKLNLILAVLVGLMGGVGAAFFIEYLDNTVKTPDDLAKYVRIPYIGPVPSYAEELGETPYERALVTLNFPKSTSAEAYRGIRTAIVFSSSAEKNSRTLLVTSSGPAEGKSLTAANLAIAMAQAGTRTVLVDADFRKPRVHRIFGYTRDQGLTNHLVGGVDLGAIVVRTKIPNLDIIPAGVVPPNPAELIGSASMRRVIEALAARYEKVVIDSPPVSAVTDSVILGTLVDDVLLVVSAGKYSRDAIRRSVDQLGDVGANVVGAVLNNIVVGQDSYYYYQYYYYYYGDEAAERGGLAALLGLRGRKKKGAPRSGPRKTPTGA